MAKAPKGSSKPQAEPASGARGAASPATKTVKAKSTAAPKAKAAAPKVKPSAKAVTKASKTATLAAVAKKPSSAAPAKAKAPKTAKSNAAPKAAIAAKAAPAPKPATAQTAPPRPHEAPRAAGPKPSAAHAAFDMLDADQRQAMDTLARNLARASFTAQTALAQAGMRGAASTPNADPFHVSAALTEVAGKLAASPEKLMAAQTKLFEGYMELWSSTARRMAGETPPPIAAAAKPDKRFKDEQWSENPVFDAIKSSYLLTSDWLNGLVGSVEDVDPMTKRRVTFFTKMLTDAFSPPTSFSPTPRP